MDKLKTHPHDADAMITLRHMDDVEQTLTEFEQNAAMEQDSMARLEQLLILNRWYRQRFGVLFEVRHSLRRELTKRAQNETRSYFPAAEIATINYKRVRGSKSPRLVASIIGGTRDEAYRKMSSS